MNFPSILYIAPDDKFWFDFGGYGMVGSGLGCSNCQPLRGGSTHGTSVLSEKGGPHAVVAGYKRGSRLGRPTPVRAGDGLGEQDRRIRRLAAGINMDSHPRWRTPRERRDRRRLSRQEIERRRWDRLRVRRYLQNLRLYLPFTPSPGAEEPHTHGRRAHRQRRRADKEPFSGIIRLDKVAFVFHVHHEDRAGRRSAVEKRTTIG